MPSKAKKSSRQPASASSSPSPRTPSTPSREAESLSGGDGELQTRRILAEASAKFPSFICESASRGRVAEAESSLAKGSHARIWLSEAAMVSASLTPGSLVSVSVSPSGKKKPLNNEFPLVSLAEECATHFGLRVGESNQSEAGNYFAIAAVFPSRKLLKDGVRLSWALACTMGFPAAGTGVFVFPIGSLSQSRNLFSTGTTSCVNLYNCDDLHLILVPTRVSDMNYGSPPVETWNTSSCDASGAGNGKVPSPKTTSYESKLSSPVSSPLPTTEANDSIRSADSSTCLDLSAIRLVLADEKVAELLEIYAARWLYGRHLLCGNFVTVPICGQICIFRVEGADKLARASSRQCLMFEDKHDLFPQKSQPSNSAEQVDAAYLVGTKTKVHLHDPETSRTAGLPTAEETYQEDGDVPKLGGLSKEYAALKEIIMFSLVNKDVLPRYKGVLLHGPPGTGKTSLASFCVRDASASLFTINGPEIVSQYYGESEQALHEVFDSAKQAAPAVVFIDELDAIAPARKDGGEELSLRLVATLLKLMDEIKRDDRILLIAATNRPDSIDPALRRPGRLDKEIEIGVPSPDQRLDILNNLLDGMDHSLSKQEIQSLALATHGFVGADLAALCNEAAMTALRRHIMFRSLDRHHKEPCAHIRGPDVGKDEDGLFVNHMDSLSSSLSELTLSSKPVYSASFPHSSEIVDSSKCGSPRHHGEERLLRVMAEDFGKAKMKVRPSAMREVMLEFPKVSWEDVGGQTKVKKQLIEAVQWPQLCPDAFKRIGIRPPRGLLMIGPPGCSKTLMARAVASEAKLNFLAVKGPELFSKWVGESEKAVRSLFAKARANAPAIIFFDEIDGLAVTRGQEKDGTSVADRVLSQLLVEMDGLDQRIGVTVIAATNRPDKIDPALLRPGRFDRLLDVQPPDENDREDIFRIHMRNIPSSSDVNTRELAHLTEGYTGADIKLICREAAIAALEESLKMSQVSMRHFKIGIGRVQPSDVQFYQELATEFRRLVDGGSARDE